jgi:ABC-2 type transport system permease protein
MSSVQMSAARPLFWSVRREVWENRSVYLAPLAVACMVLVGFFVGLFTLPARIRAAQALGPIELRETVQQPYAIAAIILMAVDLLVAVFYCVDALYGERRDRSVLFWKSLPVSDVTAVLAKASIPILVLPLVTFAATVATQAVMLLASSIVLAASGVGASVVSAHVSLVDIARINFVHLVAFHGIWWAPMYAWLLLASACATRLPFLWAVLPPVAVSVAERTAFNTAHFGSLVVAYFGGGGGTGSPAVTPEPTRMTMDMLTPHPLGHLLIDPRLWMGLTVSAVFLFSAVYLRRSRAVI